jgi:hypothetical protein
MQQLANDKSRTRFFDSEVQQNFAAALPQFKQTAKIQIKSVEPLHRILYAGDLYGYLSFIGVPSKLHWYVLKLNGKDSPTEFGDSDNLLDIPAIEEVNKFISAITAVNTLKK